MKPMKTQSEKCHCCDDKLLIQAVTEAAIQAKSRGLGRIMMPLDCISRFCHATKSSRIKVATDGEVATIELKIAPWTPEACDFAIYLVNHGVTYPSLAFDLKFAERYPWWMDEVVLTDVPMLDAARKRAKGKKTPRA